MKKDIKFKTFMEVDVLSPIVDNICNSPQELQKKATNDIETLFSCVKLMLIEEKKPKDEKPKLVAPEYIFIFDDMSAELRKEGISRLLKKNRHLKSKVILSSHYTTDLNTPARQQINYWLLFGGHSGEKLALIFKFMDLHCTFHDFIRAYEFATAEPFNFLYVDARQSRFRKNFNELLDI